jgi:4-hydroxythreonine-4-phosphate dehydrogenase
MSAPLAVSMGDPAGIGLELAARVWSEGGAPAFYVIGDSNALQRAARRIGIDTLRPRLAATVADLDPEFGGPQILHAALAIDETPGEPDPVNAEPIIGAIRGAVSCVREGAASALVTLPIAKASLYTAGFGFPGHTEFIADLVKDAPFPERTRGPVMMLAGADLRVALATIHLPLARVAEHLSVESLARVARVVCEALRFDFGIDAPRLALCGLNPHAGEGGALGREEIDIINPAAARLRDEGWDVSDAKSADTLFHAEARAGYDAVLAMYHDQGLAPLKTLHFWDAVNITLALPIIRTSPDHGTGFDIAGKGLARADSFRAALQVARDMAARRAEAK